MANHHKRQAYPVRHKTWKERVYHCLICKSWWMFLFIFLCFIVSSHAMNKKKQACQELEAHLCELRNLKDMLQQQQEDLQLQINSQSDPAWIQLMLMKGLGVVPEGQSKVYFHNDSS